MSVILFVCYFLTEIRQIFGYLHFWMIYFSEIFWRHSLDIGSLVFLGLTELTYWHLSFCVLVLTLKPLILLPFGSPGSASETSGLVYLGCIDLWLQLCFQIKLTFLYMDHDYICRFPIKFHFSLFPNWWQISI